MHCACPLQWARQTAPALCSLQCKKLHADGSSWVLGAAHAQHKGMELCYQIQGSRSTWDRGQRLVASEPGKCVCQLSSEVHGQALLGSQQAGRLAQLLAMQLVVKVAVENLLLEPCHLVQAGLQLGLCVLELPLKACDLQHGLGSSLSTCLCSFRGGEEAVLASTLLLLES